MFGVLEILLQWTHVEKGMRWAFSAAVVFSQILPTESSMQASSFGDDLQNQVVSLQVNVSSLPRR